MMRVRTDGTPALSAVEGIIGADDFLLDVGDE